MLTFWLPILVSTIALFFASFLSWMILQLHAKDWVKVDDEDKLIDTVREMNIPVGNYMYPGANNAKEMNDPAYQEKYKRGPRGFFQVLPDPSMPLNLALTMVYFFACSATFAYLASFVFDTTPDSMTRFRFVATIALLTFLASMVQHAIWFRNRITGHIIESVAYSLIAGAIFALLWPVA